MSSGGGSGSDGGGGDMQVSGMEAATSKEKGISTHADTRVSRDSFSPGVGPSEDRGGVHDTRPALGYTGVTPSNVGINPNTGKLEQESNFYSGLDNEQQAAYDQGKSISQGTLEVDPETGETRPGRYTTNPNTGQLERTDLSLSEHMKNAPGLIKWSPTLSFLWGAGKNISEWAKNKDWSYNPDTGTVTDRGGNNIGERQLMNAAAPSAPGLISGQTTSGSGSYSASQWYGNLGNNTGNAGSNPFSFSKSYEKAKAKQASILGQTTAIKQLAVNQSPFYNFLKENKLDKGIL